MSGLIDKSKRFARPVIIRSGGNDRIVVDVSAAARILLREFPRETAKRKEAMVACLGAIRGSAHTPFARRAFVVAALEVGILAGD
ncbi:MAG: DUF982 domain-containing protein [Alphaproteobacteria bacterium]|jgi:hypothetical protein|nr:DUF982 domain-containing protein [Alphaproteobacteria bacterium]MBU0805357.1 DUF982 domain-containing protein [Alphaproteobacteria bacterium]MBU0873303.1 DUF982 domain-containing protein [Alphaproteobacteria bacterium]MBU1401469.1 DUF982 domain-containing protein [Alphaproteobacteria bacterium]MBU1592114.1 DUF982 domain-containing protein [Alphaproteobacteria bacterium]